MNIYPGQTNGSGVFDDHFDCRAAHFTDQSKRLSDALKRYFGGLFVFLRCIRQSFL